MSGYHGLEKGAVQKSSFVVIGALYFECGESYKNLYT